MRHSIRHRGVVALSFAVWVVAGCGGKKDLGTVARGLEPGEALTYQVRDPASLRKVYQQFKEMKQSRMNRAAAPDGVRRSPDAAPGGPSGDDRLKVLVLSGGGQYGAWGAGYLAGWTRRQTEARPVFDVVTGISTGGLMTTGALLPDDAALKRSYTQVTQRDIMRMRCFFPLTLLFAGSVYSTRPLGERIQETFTVNVINAVADAAEPDPVSGFGRKAFVATCELESGKLVIWDLSEIARKAREKKRQDLYDLYRAVVLATASIPAAFPPVNIAGKHYVDGGARSNLFLKKAVLPTIDAAREDSSLDAYVILNGKQDLESWDPKLNTLAIAFRAVGMLLNASEQKDVQEITEFVKSGGGSLHLTAIPPKVPTGSEHQFDKKLMNELYKDGYNRGLAGDWTFVWSPGMAAFSERLRTLPPSTAASPETMPTDAEWQRF